MGDNSCVYYLLFLNLVAGTFYFSNLVAGTFFLLVAGTFFLFFSFAVAGPAAVANAGHEKLGLKCKPTREMLSGHDNLAFQGDTPLFPSNQNTGKHYTLGLLESKG